MTLRIPEQKDLFDNAFEWLGTAENLKGIINEKKQWTMMTPDFEHWVLGMPCVKYN